ncbi:response regulator [Cereibacter johrii]|uniref:response regulator n=1 Tax=Cereibacter johrii TaxID=445629 RepID=UPI003CF9D33B
MPNEPAEPRQKRGLLVLIVEDEFLIAFDLQSMLEDVGCTVLGPVGTVDAALRILGETRPDVVSLDLNLRGQSSIPVAEKLRALEIPFIVTSAYRTFDFPGGEILTGVTVIGKPAHPRMLIEALSHAYLA